MSQLLCNECPRKNCPKRVEGAVCSYDEGMQNLIKSYKTRDPEMIVGQVLGVLAEEMERYKIAKDNEKIGELEERIIEDEKGIRTITSERKVDPAISRIADGIFKNTKIMHDIVNPKKSAPLFQSNTQVNIGSGANIVADDLRQLEESERDLVLKFIDAKIDEKDN